MNDTSLNITTNTLLNMNDTVFFNNLNDTNFNETSLILIPLSDEIITPEDESRSIWIFVLVAGLVLISAFILILCRIFPRKSKNGCRCRLRRSKDLEASGAMEMTLGSQRRLESGLLNGRNEPAPARILSIAEIEDSMARMNTRAGHPRMNGHSRMNDLEVVELVIDGDNVRYRQEMNDSYPSDITFSNARVDVNFARAELDAPLIFRHHSEPQAENQEEQQRQQEPPAAATPSGEESFVTAFSRMTIRDTSRRFTETFESER